ncbi:hypothetical protein ABVK25_011994 [Lepraria finkii]|uniref:C2H2-type domain-containing protein n=1 Tax=Lepraria finkii TaxID=1340010 RepID=A0ABR4AM18_9LECA
MHHRRQNSTPVVAFEAMKVSNSNMHPTQQRQPIHRRGLSFDQHNRSPIRRQPLGSTVSITNVAQQLGQQILREAQQQRAHRPGQQNQIQTDLPVQQPQCGVYSGSSPYYSYEAMTMNSIMQNPPQMQFANSPFYPPDPTAYQVPYQGMAVVDENNPHYFQPAHQVQQVPHTGFDERRMSHPELRVHTGMRPSNSSRTNSDCEAPSSSPLPFFNSAGASPAPSLNSRPVPVLQSSQVQTRQLGITFSKPSLSPRRMSISDLNLEPGIQASIEETNVTIDDIAQFIDGPDNNDGKWVCKYEDCNKRFGRKENIKSHVQTHLGDRQFRCDHCHKCFVRGHDLKRHAKIHTGSKPYPCLCGNAFARHDALTRHRQRGMCIGAFEANRQQEEVKRGRPRKHRPEMDDRLDKATRTRARSRTTTKRGHVRRHYNSSACSCSATPAGGPTHGEYGQPQHARPSLPLFGDNVDIALFGVPQGDDGMGNDAMDNMGFLPRHVQLHSSRQPQAIQHW